jgi:hypothetical protein
LRDWVSGSSGGLADFALCLPEVAGFKQGLRVGAKRESLP